LKSFIAVDERPSLDKFANDLVENLEKTAIEIDAQIKEFKAQKGPQRSTKEFAAFLKNREHDGEKL
jgi:hypothetical protein